MGPNEHERREIIFLNVALTLFERKDINNSKLYVINLNKGAQSVREINTGQKVGVTVDIEGIDSSKTVLTGAKDGITKFDLDTGEHTYVRKYWSGEGAGETTRRWVMKILQSK